MQQKLLDDRYLPRYLLGSGGMARVYLARDEVLGRDVALKVLREQYADDEQFVERFRWEARSAASLSHPNIIQVYDRGRSGSGEYYIAMEYVPGGTLKDLILRHGTLDPDEAAAIATEVADALSTAHEKGVVHRDIKPQNVLVTRSGAVKVADFGIARAASSSAVTAASVILGTAGYMSPEQAAGEPATPRSDLYSLGVVLYEMLTGRMPFEAESPFALAMKHVTEPPRPPREVNPAVPEAVNDVVAKLLAKRPEDRYANAAEVVEDLRRVRRGEAPSARGAADREARAARDEPTMVLKPANGGGTGRARRRGKRTLLLVLAASVILVASLSAVAWAVSTGRLGEADATSAALVEEARSTLSGEIEVPDVVGLERAEAQRRLVGAGFEVEIRPRESFEADAGKVLGQSVPGGERAEEGARVSLDVGDGPDTVPAPDLGGLTLDEARGVLDEAGLALGDMDAAPSDAVPQGAVLEQTPPAGEELDPGAPVDLTLSSGPEPAPPDPVPPRYGSETYSEVVPATPTPAPTPEPAPSPESTPAAEPASPAKPEISKPVMPDLSGLPFGKSGDKKKKRKGKG